jgi:hypothetical protein
MELDVYVPADRATATARIVDAGSGIVGTASDELGRTLVDFEGNRHGAVNLVTYADRVHCAAGRHTVRYPTTARALLDTTVLVRVGTFDSETGDIDLLGADEGPDAARARIAAWCGVTPANVDAQLRTTSARHQMRREIAAARASGNPALRIAADRMARRYGTDG